MRYRSHPASYPCDRTARLRLKRCVGRSRARQASKLTVFSCEATATILRPHGGACKYQFGRNVHTSNGRTGGLHQQRRVHLSISRAVRRYSLGRLFSTRATATPTPCAGPNVYRPVARTTLGTYAARGSGACWTHGARYSVGLYARRTYASADNYVRPAPMRPRTHSYVDVYTNL